MNGKILILFSLLFIGFSAVSFSQNHISLGSTVIDLPDGEAASQCRIWWGSDIRINSQYDPEQDKWSPYPLPAADRVPADCLGLPITFKNIFLISPETRIATITSSDPSQTVCFPNNNPMKVYVTPLNPQPAPGERVVVEVRYEFQDEVITNGQKETNTSKAVLKSVLIGGTEFVSAATTYPDKWTVSVDTSQIGAGDKMITAVAEFIADKSGVKIPNCNGQGSGNIAIMTIASVPDVSGSCTAEKVNSGDSVIFRARATDPDGVSKVYLKTSKNPDCSVSGCEMTRIGNTNDYEITKTVSGPAGIYDVRITATDVKGTTGSEDLTKCQITTEGMIISIEYPEMGIIVPEIQNGQAMNSITCNNKAGLNPQTNYNCPLYTRSMGINVTVKAQHDGDLCDSDNECSVTIKILDNNGNYIQIPGSARSGIYRAYYGGYEARFKSDEKFACNQWYTVIADVNVRNNNFGKSASSKFYIDCRPKIIVTPKNRLFAVGETAKDAFDLRIINPLDTNANFVVSLTDESRQGGDTMLSIIQPSTIPGIDERTTYARLIDASRAGAYPINFTITTRDQAYLNELQKNGLPTNLCGFNCFMTSDKGVLNAFAEGLDSISFFQFLVIPFAAAVIYLLFARKHLFRNCKRKY